MTNEEIINLTIKELSNAIGSKFINGNVTNQVRTAVLAQLKTPKKTEEKAPVVPKKEDKQMAFPFPSKVDKSEKKFN